MKHDRILFEDDNLVYKTYSGEPMLFPIMEMMKDALSEPYPIYTYRYFVEGWPDCTINCFDKKENNKFIASVVGNCEEKRMKNKKKGYIAMLAVDPAYRKRGIGRKIVQLLIDVLINEYQANEVVLETEVTNKAALGLYESLGFIRTKMYSNYYLNNNSAYKLKYFIRDIVPENVSNN